MRTARRRHAGDLQRLGAGLLRRRGVQDACRAHRSAGARAWSGLDQRRSGQARALPSPPDCPAGESPGSGTLWTLQWRDGGEVRTEPLAWSHPHGRWIEWLDAEGVRSA